MDLSPRVSYTALYYYRARTYDPKVERFLQRDPEVPRPREMNSYAYVSSNPLNFTDPFGLAVWVCGRKAHGGLGWLGANHAYLWSDRDWSNCGMGDYSGKELGPPRDSCNKVEGSDGKESQIIGCCRKTADKYPWFPILNDCHEAVDDCIRGNGCTNPGAPGGRVGPIN